jgi:hypothetical protein
MPDEPYLKLIAHSEFMQVDLFFQACQIYPSHPIIAWPAHYECYQEHSVYSQKYEHHYIFIRLVTLHGPYLYQSKATDSNFSQKVQQTV